MLLSNARPDYHPARLAPPAPEWSIGPAPGVFFLLVEQSGIHFAVNRPLALTPFGRAIGCFRDSRPCLLFAWNQALARGARWLTATLPRIRAQATAIGQVRASPSRLQAQATAISGTR